MEQKTSNKAQNKTKNKNIFCHDKIKIKLQSHPITVFNILLGCPYIKLR